MSRFAQSRLARVVLLALFVGAMSTTAAWADSPSREQRKVNSASKELRKEVTVKNIRKHQQAFQRFADRSGGNRFSGFAGHDLSAQYVYDKARRAGYQVSFQEFEYLAYFIQGPFRLEQIAPTPTLYVENTDYQSMDQSEPGDVTATVTAVDINLTPPRASTSGCEASDFAGFPNGNIALIQRGTCTFQAKAENAAAAGAVGVIIFNQGNTPDREGLFAGTLSAAYPQNNVPVVATTFARGAEWAGTSGLTMRMVVDTVREIKTTRNVIAESKTGDPNNVVVVGAHLDSVSAGPGINDNGSGSGTILEIALALDDEFEVNENEDDDGLKNRLRFIWFAAEESGLVGSGVYVDSLPVEELAKIDLMLNFDMVGSPNYVRFVYDGDGVPTGTVGPPGSDAIETVFTNYFASRGLPNEPTPFSGRSDYGPFIAVGIPAGGLFTGAEGIKTAEQAAVYGGTAGEQYDPCYHEACDTFAGTSTALALKGLDEMSDAAAHAVATYGFGAPLTADATAAAGVARVAAIDFFDFEES